MKTVHPLAWAVISYFAGSVVVFAGSPASPDHVVSPEKPNIIVILADDLGYGDLGCYGATKVATPRLDALAAGGVRFTDAHCTAATCTPSRYSMLTGQYAFRNSGAEILSGEAPLLIDAKGPTLPGILRSAGYATAVVGKWHLGVGNGKIDWNGAITPGPNDVGFDYAYYLVATPDRVPCVYVENRRVVNLTPGDPLSTNYRWKVGKEPTGHEHPEMLRYPADAQHSGTIVDHISRIGFMAGGHSAWWVDEDMAACFLSKASAFIEQSKGKPFFLYYAPHNVHVPRAPNNRFLHASQCGIRGDSIAELDATVGGLLDTLKRLNLLDNTLIVFSSDNGPIFNDGYADGSVKEANGHRPAGPYRGGKYQIYEGGTRVPFIVSWPGKIAPAVSAALVNQVDLFASLADLVGASEAGRTRPDSQDVLPALLGKTTHARDTMIEQSVGRLALRDGPWKLIPAGSPEHVKFALEGDTTQGPPAAAGLQLFDLTTDPGETRNVAAEHPDIVRKMSSEFEQIRQEPVPAPTAPR